MQLCNALPVEIFLPKNMRNKNSRVLNIWCEWCLENYKTKNDVCVGVYQQCYIMKVMVDNIY